MGWMDGDAGMGRWMRMQEWVDGWGCRNGWMDEDAGMFGWMGMQEWVDGWGCRNGMDG